MAHRPLNSHIMDWIRRFYVDTVLSLLFYRVKAEVFSFPVVVSDRTLVNYY